MDTPATGSGDHHDGSGDELGLMQATHAGSAGDSEEPSDSEDSSEDSDDGFGDPIEDSYLISSIQEGITLCAAYRQRIEKIRAETLELASNGSEHMDWVRDFLQEGLTRYDTLSAALRGTYSFDESGQRAPSKNIAAYQALLRRPNISPAVEIPGPRFLPSSPTQDNDPPASIEEAMVRVDAARTDHALCLSQAEAACELYNYASEAGRDRLSEMTRINEALFTALSRSHVRVI